jgi:hypothetical protein
MTELVPDGDLRAWIAELRERLDRGDLTRRASVDIGHGTADLPLALAVRVMLADLDSFEAMDPDEAEDPVNVARRASLLADFRTLQLLFG